MQTTPFAKAWTTTRAARVSDIVDVDYNKYSDDTRMWGFKMDLRKEARINTGRVIVPAGSGREAWILLFKVTVISLSRFADFRPSIWVGPLEN